MNKVLEYNVTGQNIELASAAMLVAGTVNEYTARFAFSADWDGYQRVAVFNADGTEREQLLTDDTCKVPWEVLLPGAYLKVGVYGTRDGSRLPTIWTTHRQRIHDGAGPTEEAADPSPTLVEQLLARMGDLSTLETEDKSSLVAAINEVWSSGGSGGSSVTDASINEDGHLIITLSTGKLIDAGYAVGPAGSDGQDGADGKSAYQYAKDGGYTGTEAEFAAKLAAEIPAVDDTLTASGKAADAAAVGARFSSLSEEIANKAANVYIGPVQPTDGTLYWLDTSDSGGSGGETVTHTVTSALTNVRIDNTAASVNDGASFAATLTPFDGYTLSSATVTMGGNDITASAYASGNIYIASVTGDIVITAAAVEVSEGTTTYTIWSM